jgi:hypothetical protein
MPSMPARQLDGFSKAFEATRRGGCNGHDQPDASPSQTFSFPLARIVAEARTIKGSYIGTCVPGRDIPAFIQLYRQGRMPVNKLVTRSLKLDQINEAFDALSDAKGGAPGGRFLVVVLGFQIGNVAEGYAHRGGLQCAMRAAEIQRIPAVAQVDGVDDGVQLVVGSVLVEQRAGPLALLS